MVAIPFETGDHHLTTGMPKSGRVRSTATLVQRRSHAIAQAPIAGQSHIIGIEVRNVGNERALTGLRNGVEQGCAQFLFADSV